MMVENMKGFLLNFRDSQFANQLQIGILKNDIKVISVDCAYDPISVYNWLVENEIINPDDEYDEKSGLIPSDNRTILKNKAVFELTNYPKNKGRKVYRRIGTDQLWVVDSSKRHAGEKAHIEIFNEVTGKHIGTSICLG